MRKIKSTLWSLMFALAIMCGLTACGPSWQPESYRPYQPQQSLTQGYTDRTDVELGEAYVYEVNTPDGAVPCIIYSPYNDTAGSIDCDWSVIRDH